MFSAKEKEILRALVEQEIHEVRKNDVLSCRDIKRIYLRTLVGLFRKTREELATSHYIYNLI